MNVFYYWNYCLNLHQDTGIIYKDIINNFKTKQDEKVCLRRMRL